MKQYVTHGTGSAQTLSEVQNTNVVVYDTKADAEADLSNLSEGQIVATKDSGDELAQPVDVIASGNMHAVTSNAVANSNAMPVDQVALNNLHSVTSNAVAQALNGLLRFEIIESESFTINAGSSLDVAVTFPQINGYSIGVAFYFRNQSSNALYSGKYIITIGGSSGTAWMSNPTNTDITTKIEVMVMYIKQIN